MNSLMMVLDYAISKGMNLQEAVGMVYACFFLKESAKTKTTS